MNPTLTHILRSTVYPAAGAALLAVIKVITDQIAGGTIPTPAVYTSIILILLSAVASAIHAAVPAIPGSPTQAVVQPAPTPPAAPVVTTPPAPVA